MRRRSIKRLVGLLFIIFVFTLVSVLSLFLIVKSHHRRNHDEESQTERWLRTRRESKRAREEELPPEDHFERTMKEFIGQETDPRFEFQTLGNASAPKMGLLIPFRARDDYEEKRLSGFLWFMHWYFRTRTHLAYRMIVLEQEDGKPFNRGKLLNTGVLLSKDKFDYYVLHDLDERPWSQVDYNIPEQGAPTHMMTARSRYNYSPVTMEADPVYTGGVMKITAGDYIRVNGFSNSFWGWGHEDRDFGHRIWNSGLTLKRLAPDIGRFRSTPEEEHGHRDKDSAEANAELVNHTTDGLSDTTFKLLSASHSQHHSRYLVSI